MAGVMAATERHRRRRDKDKHPGRGRPAPASPDVVDVSQDSSGGAMVTSPSTTAPADAGNDAAADQADADMEAFFGSGHGPALHYDRSVGATPGTQEEGAG